MDRTAPIQGFSCIGISCVLLYREAMADSCAPGIKQICRCYSASVAACEYSKPPIHARGCGAALELWVGRAAASRMQYRTTEVVVAAQHGAALTVHSACVTVASAADALPLLLRCGHRESITMRSQATRVRCCDKSMCIWLYLQ